MKNIILFIVGLFIINTGIAQQVIHHSINSGGTTLSGNNSVGFIVGQLVVEPMGNDSLSLGHGYDDLVITNISDEYSTENDLNISVYPNPSNKELNIALNEIEYNQIIFELYDMSGKQLIYKSEKNKTPNVYLDMSNFVQGTYILHITLDNTRKTYFKVQKF